MADITGMLQASAGATKGQASGNYIALGAIDGLYLLDNTNPGPGTVTIAYFYALTPATPGAPRGVSYTSDGLYIATAGYFDSPNYFALFDASTAGSLSLLATYTLGAGARACQFSPDGNYIAVSLHLSPYFTLLDHTTPGTVSLAATLCDSFFAMV